MVNRMEMLNQYHIDNLNKLNKLNISEDKTTHQYRNRSEKAIPRGQLFEEIYENYYDIDSTITTAQATNPNDPDAQINVGGTITNVYNQERIFEVLERNAPYIWVSNDAALGGPVLFTICAHKGGQSFSKERPIYPQQFKVYKNAYEIRLRSAVAGHAYRVSEYEMGTV